MVAFWRRADIRVGGQLPGNQGVRVTCSADPDARLTVADAAFMRQLAPRLTKRAGPRRRWLRWTGAVLASVAVLGGIAAGLPLASRSLAVLVPLSWETRLGSQLAQGLEAQWGTCGAPAGTAALDFLASRLTARLPEDARPRISVVRRPELNALALPGGRILLFRGLIESAESPDEVAGVLAHEITHVTERHVTAAVIRGLGVGLLATLITGDASGSVASAAAVLVVNAYSRDDEAAADRGAVRLLEQAGIDPRGLGRFFERIAGQDAVPEWLSTHPDPAARASAVAALARHRPAAPALGPEQWAAVKAMCG